MFKIDIADRIKNLPPYLFKEIDRKKEEVKKKGIDIIDLGVGDPDTPTHDFIIEALNKAAKDPANHRYPSYTGLASFTETAAEWFSDRFNVKLDPSKEIISLIGSKEGIAHIPLALINPGDIALVTSPGYPVYDTAVNFAGGTPYYLDLLKENDFLPDLDSVPEDIAKKAKLIFLNYPNNPTSGVADKVFFNKLVRFAKKYNIIVCHDAAYTEVYYDEKDKPMSFLETEGAKSVGIEFHSLSKTYNMTGWRIGFAAGNAEVVQALGKVKSNIDSGVFQAVQLAGIEAFKKGAPYLSKMNQEYKERRDIIFEGLTKLGLKLFKPRATFYMWIETPDGYNSFEFAEHLLTKAGIVVTPGNGFGKAGEGYVRISLTINKNRLKEAVSRIEKIGF
jgi:LL-diaminopimelate aminotransferase